MAARALTLLVALLAGAQVRCGYRFAAGGGSLPEDITRVRAPLFANHAAEPGLEIVFTRALREQLLQSGVHSDPSSEAELRGEILGVWGGPTILTTGTADGGEPQLASYRIFATAKLTLVKGGRVLREADVSGSEDYLPGFEDILRTDANRQAALQRLAFRLMRDGYELLRTR
jgi:Lipopolysaccharide-assembly